MKLKVKKLTDTAKLPTKNLTGDVGYDIYSDEDIDRIPGKIEAIKTGIAIEIPEGYGALLVGRSGRTSKTPFRVNLGVIDNGYRGELLVMNDVLPDGKKAINKVERIRKGDKIAQLIILPIYELDVEEVEELSITDRGEKGFGSSGMV